MSWTVKIEGNFFVIFDTASPFSEVFRSTRAQTSFVYYQESAVDYFEFKAQGANFIKNVVKYDFTDLIDSRTGVVFTSVGALSTYLSQNIGDFFFNNQKINVTPYNEQLVAEKTTLIELKSIYGISEIRDVVTTAEAGAVTNDNREYRLAISTANNLARLTSSERGRYIPGKSAEYGIGVRLDVTSVTGDTVLKWGALNDENGIYFGLDSTGLFVSILDDSVEIDRIYQASWNLDKLNGTGPSGETIDLTDGNIFQAQYTWYGYGIITFRVQLKSATGMKLIDVHNYVVDDKVSINDPNLPITGLAQQTASTNTVNMYIGGRQFSILGTYTPNFRNTSDYVLAKSVATLSGTPIPIISFRHKTAYKAVSARLRDIDFITDTDIILEVYIGNAADLTGAVFAAPLRTKATETAFEVDKTASAINISNGNLIYRALLKGGERNTTNQQDFESILLDVPENKVLTVTGFALSSTATVSGLIRLNEEW